MWVQEHLIRFKGMNYARPKIHLHIPPEICENNMLQLKSHYYYHYYLIEISQYCSTLTPTALIKNVMEKMTKKYKKYKK